MPIFDMYCDRCRLRKDIRGHYDEVIKCDDCGEEMRRLVTAHAKTASKWVVNHGKTN